MESTPSFLSPDRDAASEQEWDKPSRAFHVNSWIVANLETIGAVTQRQPAANWSYRPFAEIEIGRDSRNLAAALIHLILLKKSGWGLEVGRFSPFPDGSYMLAYTQNEYVPFPAAASSIPSAPSSLNETFPHDGRLAGQAVCRLWEAGLPLPAG